MRIERGPWKKVVRVHAKAHNANPINLNIVERAVKHLNYPTIRRPTGNQEVAGSTPAEVGNILS